MHALYFIRIGSILERTERKIKTRFDVYETLSPNRCLYIKVAKIKNWSGGAETSFPQNCGVKLFKEHFKVQICKGRLFEKKIYIFFLIFTN